MFIGKNECFAILASNSSLHGELCPCVAEHGPRIVGAMSKLPLPGRLAGPPPSPPSPPRPTAVRPDPAPPPQYTHEQAPLPPPVQQVIIQPRQGVSAGQVVLIVIAVLVLAPFVSCVMCSLAVGGGIQAASNASSSRPASSPAAEAPSPPVASPEPSKPSEPLPATVTGDAKAGLDPALFRWKYSTRDDAMTGKATRMALLLSETTYQLGFPYRGGTIAMLRIVQHPRNGLNITVNIENGQLTCHSFMNCRILVRFDDRPPIKFRGLESADHDTKTVFLEPEKKFMKELRSSTHVVIELPFFGEGNRLFHFNTADLEWD